MGALRALYADILWDALRERPVVVLLEDMEKLDCHSLNVMCLIARRLQQDHAIADIAADVQHTQRGTVILCTARHYSLLCDGGAVGMLEPGRALPETPEPVLCLHLRELDDSKMAQIARAFLGQSLAEPVVSLIVGESLLQSSLLSNKWSSQPGVDPGFHSLAPFITLILSM
jgi:hypothetical protein